MREGEHPTAGDGLDLTEAVRLLRRQLTAAQREADGSDVRFKVGEVTVELAVELTRAASAGGGLRFGVAAVDAKRDRTRHTTHRIQLTLHPRDGSGGDLEIGDRDD
ncbi:trypco2 family protein [Streptomyces sp. NPDC001478]